MTITSVKQLGALSGRMLTRAVPSMPYARYTVCPGPDLKSGPILVAVHGISRDHNALMSALSTEAQRNGYTLIAPIFNERIFGDYQRLGRSGLGERADLALNAILDDAKLLLDINGPKHLLGFSGGAQFAHRYVYAWPDRFQTVTLVAAGWYTSFSSQRRFPMGQASTPRLEGLTFDASSLLRTPTHVLIGENDTKRDSALRKRDSLDRRQGRDRLARARWFHRELVRRSSRLLLDIDHRLTVLPNCGHDVVETAIRGNLARHVFEFMERNHASTTHIASA